MLCALDHWGRRQGALALKYSDNIFIPTLAMTPRHGWKAAEQLLAILGAWRNLGSAVEIFCANAGDAPVVQVQTPIAPECKQNKRR